MQEKCGVTLCIYEKKIYVYIINVIVCSNSGINWVHVKLEMCWTKNKTEILFKRFY